MSDRANGDLTEKVFPQGSFRFSSRGLVMEIRASALPRGVGVSIAAYAPSGNVREMESNLVLASPQCTGS
jgi:hypothetical protein